MTTALRGVEPPSATQGAPAPAPDLERRFGGLARLYGDAAYRRLRASAFAIVGLGGVGSWTVEALARSGAARLVLIDLDHVSESNVNRQVQAVDATLGMAKAQALADRVASIHAGCDVHAVEDFVDGDNWPALLPAAVDVVVDACDQARAKFAVAAWSLATRSPLVCVGAAGGKRRADRVEVADLADTTHDPLLAGLRQRLRRDAVAPRRGGIGVRCVFSREAVSVPPNAVCDIGAGADRPDGSLNCHGYGSSVAVTATFGMVAAAEAIDLALARR